MNSARLSLLVVLILFAATSGCSSRLFANEEAALDRDASRPYPVSLVRRPSLPIQVLRETNTISLTNTTAHAFGPSTIWLNSRFGLEIESLAIGQTITLNLDDFTDEFGAHFRGGGFFAIVDPDPLVRAEIETDGKIAGMIVTGNLYE